APVVPLCENAATIAVVIFCPNRSLIFLVLILAGLWRGKPAFGADRSWHVEKGFTWAELTVPSAGKAGFTLLPPAQTGIHFTNELDEWKGEANRVLSNGSGLAAGDFDHDGLPDLYFCSLQGRNALYKNLGDGAFKNVTAESGIVCS